MLIYSVDFRSNYFSVVYFLVIFANLHLVQSNVAFVHIIEFKLQSHLESL
jgi:hypothetical protein